MSIIGGKLKLNSGEYDILHFNYHFQRDIDTKGRPCSVYYGGDITVQVESTDDIRLFQQMVYRDMPSSSGSIEIYDEDEVCIRRIEFEEAYIYAFGEEMHRGSFPVVTTICISPMRLDFNNNALRLDRRWPYADGWEKYKPQEQKYAKTETEPNIEIIEAYWIDEENKVRKDLDVEYPVTLYVVTDSEVAGKSIDLYFESREKSTWKAAECTGSTDAKGIITIANFKLETVKETKDGESDH